MTGIAGEQAGQRSHARRNHELLVAAAREVFAERGVEASLEEIARRAGVGVGTLYRHFATREALVEAVFERRIGELVASPRPPRPSPTAGSRSSACSSGSLEIAGRRPPAQGRLPALAAGRRPRASAAREEMRAARSSGARARPRARAACASDFAFPDLALLLWSFSPLIDATAEVAPSAWRRHLHWLLDGLRAEAATPQAEPPLSGEQLQAAVQALRSRRLGRRSASS